MSECQLGNKIWYAVFGGAEAFVPSCSGLQHQLTLTTSDGLNVPLPEGTEGIVVTNIASYGGGSHLWV